MKSWIREKKYECGEYRTVGIYAVTDQEHRQRGRKHKESSRGQKARNKNASMRRYQRKVLANFDKDGFYVTGTYEDAYRPESFEDCVQDVRNYVRRVKAAVIRRFGEQRARQLKLSLHAVRNGEKGEAAHARLCRVQGPDGGRAEGIPPDAGRTVAAAGAGYGRV